MHYTQLLHTQFGSVFLSSSGDCRSFSPPPIEMKKKTQTVVKNECIIWMISSHGSPEGPVNKLNALDE